MKAVVCERYGSPDVLRLKEVDKPTPADDEVLVRVHAVSVNAADWHTLKGEPFIARPMLGSFRKPKFPVLGSDIAGRVEAVGKNVTQFRPGDEVFGGIGRGGFAEYAVARESRLLSKPPNVPFEAVAAIPIAATTALQGLRDAGQIRPGQKVLVNGASGGVGHFAVQIAKSFGAEVTGVCSTRNLDMVRSIGADHVIDYRKEDFTRNGRHYDLIFDAVGNRSVLNLNRALSPQGRCVVAGFTSLPGMFGQMVIGPLMSKMGSKKVGSMGIAKLNPKDMAYLRDLLETGKIVPVIDRRYPLSGVPEALRYLGKRHARGKVIITVEQ